LPPYLYQSPKPIPNHTESIAHFKSMQAKNQHVVVNIGCKKEGEQLVFSVRRM
jgi:hypothetical protein